MPVATDAVKRRLPFRVGIAIDASGSVWTANSGDNTIAQFIGLATAVRTPLALRFNSFENRSACPVV